MKSNDRRRYPLRKVVNYWFDEYKRRVERLECGHVQRAVQDFIGETNAYRRRCRQCWDERNTKKAEDKSGEGN